MMDLNQKNAPLKALGKNALSIGYSYNHSASLDK